MCLHVFRHELCVCRLLTTPNGITSFVSAVWRYELGVDSQVSKFSPLLFPGQYTSVSLSVSSCIAR